jgi:hypothetical protein
MSKKVKEIILNQQFNNIWCSKKTKELLEKIFGKKEDLKN